MATVVAMVADGVTLDEILADIPELEAEAVAEALRYAAEAGCVLVLTADGGDPLSLEVAHCHLWKTR